MALKRTEINRMVMDYLVTEGFKEAAEKFKVEAGVEIKRLNNESVPETSEQLDQRIEIRSAIEDGKISTALWLINQYYPELIDQNRHLFFKLHVSTAMLNGSIVASGSNSFLFPFIPLDCTATTIDRIDSRPED